MANVVEKFGLRPYRKLDGTPLAGAQNRYTISANNSTAIYQGDLVIPEADGDISRHIAGTSALLLEYSTDVFTQILQRKSLPIQISTLVQ
jgi:hypothetical protein